MKGNNENLLTLLHLTSILGSKNDHLFLCKVDGHRGTRGHTLGISVCWERTSVVDGVIWVKVLKILAIRSDEHVAHEKSVVGTSTDNSNLDLVLLVPSCESVDDVDTVSCVQIIDGTFSVDSPDL